MTRIMDRPEQFAADALVGFAGAFPDHVRLVRGGVVRATQVKQGKVSLVVGGGSGHYPAFAGYVGVGMADAAVAGEVFASPSAAAAMRVCRNAHFGGGILLGFGNYAGDVLHFGAAAERLRAEGIDVRILRVTDDVASAGADARAMRRGIAGNFTVFKMAGAAAEAGLDLDEVERVAILANERSFSMGVAFAGCTLPGSHEPLFTVPKSKMALGLGIHGEPGIEESVITTASEMAQMLVGKLLAERPASARRAAVLLNGLGATKYEELFVLWAAVEKQLKAADVEIVAPVVGEYITSLDMAGCSLTISWLDDVLEPYWLASCDTPSFHRAATRAPLSTRALIDDVTVTPQPALSSKSAAAANCLTDIMQAIADCLAKKEDELGAMDAIAGDGDHGQGMRRGAMAALEAMRQAVAVGAGAQTTLAAGADAWADRAGGTSGAIWGILIRAWSRAFSDEAGIEAENIVQGARFALDEVTRLGGAQAGDKTLVDALIPFVETLEAHFSHSHDLNASWNQAAAICQQAALATAPLRPRLGRARPLAERSVGHPDAGCISLALIAQTVGEKMSSSN